MKKMRAKKLLGAALAASMVLVSGLPANAAGETAEDSGSYDIYPIPQSIEYTGGTADLSSAALVYSDSVDQAAKDYLEKTLSDNGVKTGTDGIRIIAAIESDGQDEIDLTLTGKGIEDNYDAYTLKVDDDKITISGNDNDALFAGISTLDIMLEQSEDHKLLKTEIVDYADVQYRGVVEGYYGIPWSNENVISYMEWGSKFKLNTFIYAPKDDPYHNSQWREPYPQEKLDAMKDMIEAGTRTKLRFVYAIHPFMSNGINKEDFDAEVKHITDKFQQLYDLGVRQFALLADDASSETALQVKTINALTDWLNSKEGTYPLIFCPQSYSGTPNANYFAQFTNGTTITIGGKQESVPAVAEDVEIMYTGSAIIGNVEPNVVNNFKNAAGRYPYFWLNWPVNDYTDSSLFIGKAEMLKEGDIHLNGLVSNPMCEAQLSKIGLFQVADYAWNMDDFDVDSSWKASFANVDADAADALAEVAKHMSYPKDGVYHTTGLAWEESEELVPFINALKAKVESGGDATAEAEALEAELQKILEATAGVMELSENELLKGEFEPYKKSLDATLHAGVSGLDALEAYYTGDYDTAWGLVSTVGGYIDESNSVTKPGLKPAGNVQLEVKPGTKYLRPLAAWLYNTVSDLINSILQGDSAEPVPYYNFTDWPGDRDSELLKYMDNDDSTFAALETAGLMQRVGDYFGIDLGAVENVTHIRVLQGKTDADKNIYHYGVLEVSENGEDWTTLVDFTEGTENQLVETDTNVSARYVRMRLTQQGYGGKIDYWFHVRSFDVTVNDGPALYTSLNDTSSMSVSTENGRTTLDMDGVALGAEDYAGIDLKAIEKVTVGADGLPAGMAVQYSKNGKSWEEAQPGDDVIARYIRVTGPAEGITAQLTADTFEVEPSSVEYGSASGTADGYSATTIDNPATELFRVTGLSEGEHTIYVRSRRGDHGDKISVDRFEIKNGDATEQVNLTTTTEGLTLTTDGGTAQWSNWSPKANWLNEDELFLTDTTGMMEYTFTGTEIALYGARSNNMGYIDYSIDGMAYDQSGDLSFDGQDSTMAHYLTDHVTVDLGQSIKINHIMIKTGEETLNQDPGLCLGSGKIEVSANGNDWTDVTDFALDSVDAYEHEVPYYYFEADTDVNARYIRIALDEAKEFAINEIIVNGGAALPADQDYALAESTVAQTNENPLSNLTDGSLSTGFCVEAQEGDTPKYVQLDMSGSADVTSITIVQNAETISGAKVEVLSGETWKEIGVLENAINVFDTTRYKDVYAVRIYATDEEFDLMEITYKTGTVEMTETSLVSITAPAAVTGIANGAEKTAEALGLPKTVNLVLSDGSAAVANVTWDVDGCSYDPSKAEAQTFEVKGTVVLPAGVTNPDAISLSVTVSVTVDAKQEVHEHVFDKEVVADKYLKTAATCTSPAVYYKSCECGETGTETFVSGEALGHQFGEWETVTSPTCTDKGSEKRVCSECGYTEVRDLDAAGHSWEEDYTVDKEATCTEDGSRSIHCSKCEAVKDSEVIPATGHSFGEWRVTKEPTETEDGSRERTCADCGYTETEKIPSIGGGDPGTDEPGTDEPGTDKPGTDKPGSDKPGADKPDTDKPAAGGQSGSDTPKTGDNSAAPWAALAVLAGAAMIIVRRRTVR